MSNIDIKINIDTATVKDAKEELNRLKKEQDNLIKGSDDYNKVAKNIDTVNNSLAETNNELLEGAKNFKIFGVSFNDLSNGLKSAQTGIKGLTLGFRGLAGAIAATGIGALVVAVGLLVTYFTQTKEGVELLEVAFAKLKAVFEPIIASIAKVGGGLAKILSGDVKGGIDEITKSFNGVGNAISQNVKSTENYIKGQRELDDLNRESIITQSQLQKEIDQLVAKEKNKTLTDKQRLEILDQIDQKEREKLKNQEVISKKTISLLDEEAKRLEKLGKDGDDIVEKKNQEIAKLNKLEGDSLKVTEKTDNKRDAIAQKNKERLEKETLKKQEELKKQQELEQKYLTDIENLRNEFQLTEEETLTKQFDDKIALIKGQTEEELQLIKDIETQKQIALDELKQKQLDKEKQDRIKQFEEKANDDLLNLETELLRLGENDILRNEKQNEIDEKNKEILLNKFNEGLISEAEYNNQIEKINQGRRERELTAEEENKVLQQQIQEAKFKFATSITQGLSALSDLIGQESEKGAKFAKAVALFQIGIDTAKSISSTIAGATAAAQAGGPAAPFLIGSYIASGLATVFSGFAQAKKALSSAPQPKQQQGSKPVNKFNTGGFVSGPGTTTSDSIPAMLSNGESVINANSTRMFQPLLSRINEIGGGVRFNQGGIAGQTSSSNQSIINSEELANTLVNKLNATPIRSYVIESEITSNQQRVEILRNRANI